MAWVGMLEQIHSFKATYKLTTKTHLAKGTQASQVVAQPHELLGRVQWENSHLTLWVLYDVRAMSEVGVGTKGNMK